MQNVLETKKKIARDMMNQQVKKELKSQVIEKRHKEINERQSKIDAENLKNIVNSMQCNEEFTKDMQVKQVKKETLKNDLQNLIKDNTVKKIKNHIGITKEEITLNK